MAEKFFIRDHGPAVWHAGELWSRLGTTTSNPPDASLDAVNGDISFPGPVTTFNNPDAQGSSVYSAAEELIAESQYGGSIASTDSWSTLIASVPVTGVLRVWNEAGKTTSIRINGISVSGDISGDKVDSKPINVLAGDLVEVAMAAGTTSDVTFMVIPFEYTPPA